MDIKIHFDREIDEAKSLELDGLVLRLAEDDNLNIERVYKDLEPGTKVGDLTIAISIASLVLSSISTVITVLSYLKSQKPNYTISVKYGETTVTIDNVSPKALKSKIADIKTYLQMDTSDSNIEVVISKNEQS